MSERRETFKIRKKIFGDFNENGDFVPFSESKVNYVTVTPINPETEVVVSKAVLDKLYRIAVGFDMRNRGGLAGQAFTEYTCLYCLSDKAHPNTNAPNLCPDCADQIKKQYREAKEPES